MAVTHCICVHKSFREVLDWAREHNVESLPLIAQELGCSSYCGMCGPFIEYALATGETNIPFPCPLIPPPKDRREI
jgi:bacterioferritin-associated ferredoxin